MVERTWSTPTLARAPASKTGCKCDRWTQPRLACSAKGKSSIGTPSASRRSKAPNSTKGTAFITSWRLLAASSTAGSSRSVFGPYEARVILEQGATSINGPHQGALVDTPHGEWWFVHFQQLGVYGRVVHLNPVIWQDGWPLMGEAGADGRRQPVLRHAKPAGPPRPITTPSTSDEFVDARLSPAFQWHANHRDDWFSLSARPGFLRLFPQVGFDFAAAPSLLLQKIPGPAFTIETWLELTDPEGGVRAGLIVMGEHHAALAVTGSTGGHLVRLLVDGVAVYEAHVNTRGVRLRVSFSEGGSCRFAHGAKDGPLTELSHTFQAVPGRWIGAKLGLFSVCEAPTAGGAYADFDYFRFGQRDA